MRIIKKFGIFLLAAALPLCGCAQAAPQGQREGLIICASFSTIADFTNKIVGESTATVLTLVPDGAEPHDWEPTAQDIARLEQADVLVINGAGFEHWVDRVLQSLQQAPLVVDTSQNAERLAGDPHIWLNPLNAARQMETICDALAGLDPGNAAYYRQNLDDWAAECARLDADYRGTIEALPGRHIVVAHAAFGYLCHAYGLEQVAVQGLSPEGEPDPARMADVVALARDYAVPVIFFEEAASPKVAEAIAREIGAETAVLSPLEGFTEEQAAAGADYFRVMRDNLEQLKVALQ